MKNDLWLLRLKVHGAMYFRQGRSSMPVIEYWPIDASPGNHVNVFAAPTWFPKPRESTEADRAGGVFTSTRTELGPANEAKQIKDMFGENARRLHAATDFLMTPGDTVLAPMSGTLERATYSKTEEAGPNTLFHRLIIRNRDGIRATVLYVIPGALPSEVQAGVTVLGVADDLSRSPGYRAGKVPNHVHVDFVDKKGRKFDPYSNQVVERLPWPLGKRPIEPTNLTVQ